MIESTLTALGDRRPSHGIEHDALEAFREVLRMFSEERTVEAFREVQRAGLFLDHLRFIPAPILDSADLRIDTTRQLRP
jgi:hypothetical protein